MTKKMMIVLAVLVLIGSTALMARNGKGAGTGNGAGQCLFIDENGDGINDNFRDHDGDGIPNYLDEDWTRPQDGSGYGRGNRTGNAFRANRGSAMGTFREMRFLGQGMGNGICDGTAQRAGSGRRNGRR